MAWPWLHWTSHGDETTRPVAPSSEGPPPDFLVSEELTSVWELMGKAGAIAACPPAHLPIK